jgi:uncharacterized protein DUF4870
VRPTGVRPAPQNHSFLAGFVFLAIRWVLNAVFVIIAAIKASDGKFYRYAMTIRFIQQGGPRAAAAADLLLAGRIGRSEL